MTFFEAIAAVIRRYAEFAGRSRRAEYWFWTLFTMVAGLCLTILDLVMFPYHEWGPLSSLFSIAFFVPGLAVSVRRLHDIDRSGWWLLIGLVPLIGLILLIIWFTRKGTTGDNRFGPDPLAAPAEALPATA